MKNKKKLLVVLACLALCVCTVVTSTLAWLTDKSETVTNTFTTSDINITLTETLGTVNGTNREFKMVPGATIPKDPKVTVLSGSEACWLFVKVEKGNDFDTYMSYAIADGWTELTGVSGVYYRKVTEDADDDQSFSVLAGDVVTVKGTVNKAQMETANESKPTMTFTAYACQLKQNNTTEFTAADAWDLVKDLPAKT